MSTALDTTRAELALLVLYLNKAEARDKICRAIQYGSKFISNGEPGTAQNVDKTTSLARKVFRLFKFVNDLHALISPPAAGTPLPLIFLGKSKNALISTFLFLDQIVWAHRTGIYKNKERAELIGRISLYCWLGSSTCGSMIELAEIKRLSKSIKKLNKQNDEQYEAKLKKSNERLLALVKSSMDMVVAVGLLQLAPTKVTPRVTGAFGLASSLISCYQLLPAKAKVKRVQKYVELLDVIKAKNSTPRSNSQTNQQPPQPKPNQQPPQPKPQLQNHQYSKDSYLQPKLQPQPQPQQNTDPSLQPKPQARYNNGVHIQLKPELQDSNVSHLPLKLPPKYYNGSHLQPKTQPQYNNGLHPQPPPPWEQIDLLSSMPSTSLATSTTTIASIPTPRYDWELF